MRAEKCRKKVGMPVIYFEMHFFKLLEEWLEG